MSLQVSGEGLGDAAVAGGFAVPAAGAGAGAQVPDVGELAAEGAGVLRAGDEVCRRFRRCWRTGKRLLPGGGSSSRVRGGF